MTSSWFFILELENVVVECNSSIPIHVCRNYPFIPVAVFLNTFQSIFQNAGLTKRVVSGLVYKGSQPTSPLGLPNIRGAQLCGGVAFGN